MGFFGKLWKAAKRVAKVALDNGGIIGGVIDGILIEIWGEDWHLRGGVNNPYAENQVELWNDNYFTPWFANIAPRLYSKDVNSPSYRAFFNDVLLNLYAWKAYFEFVALKETDEDEIDIARLKIQYIDGYIYALIEGWKRTTSIAGFDFYPYPFNPTTITKVGTETLDWRGVESITAEKFILTDKPHGGLPPNGGGGTTTTSGGGNTPGGNTTGGGGTTTGGGTNSNTGGGTTYPQAYYKLNAVEKAIYQKYFKDKNLKYFNSYRQQNPNYKPTTALLKLLGLPTTGIPYIPGHGSTTTGGSNTGGGNTGGGNTTGGNSTGGTLDVVKVKSGVNPNTAKPKSNLLKIGVLTIALLGLYKFSNK